MKICLVPDFLPGLHETWSGAEVVCLRLAQMLQEEGHDVVFMTTTSREKDTPGQIYQIPRPLIRFGRLSQIFPLDISSLLYSIVALRKLKPDIVHLHTKYLFLPVLISAIILRIPVVLTVLDYFIICPINILKRPNGQICADFHGAQCFECFPQHKLSSWNLRTLIKQNVFLLPILFQKIFFFSGSLVLDYFVRKLDALITFSETSKARLRRYGLPGDKINVIYEYRLGWKMGEQSTLYNSFQNPTILFVGSLWEHKGFHVIVEAMSHVVEEIPDAKLIAVGVGGDQYTEAIRGSIRRLGLGEAIRLLGQKNNEEVMQLMERSDVVVVAEQWPSDFGPVVLVEAMALGKPIVASRIGGIPEFIEDSVSGFLATHDEPREFADKIVWLLRHKEAAQAMGESAKKLAKFLYDGKATKQIIDLYHRVIVSRCGR